jgi:hypothetical protein
MSLFLDRLNAAPRVLIAGCGGGFDVYSGIPIAMYLLRRGCSVVVANFSFSRLPFAGCERIAPTAWRVEASARPLNYFPEKWLAEWLAPRSIIAPVYAFAKTGVRPLRLAYEAVLHRHPSDLVVLVDGGTDSLIFGDEPGLGTVAEDARTRGSELFINPLTTQYMAASSGGVGPQSSWRVGGLTCFTSPAAPVPSGRRRLRRRGGGRQGRSP